MDQNAQPQQPVQPIMQTVEVQPEVTQPIQPAQPVSPAQPVQTFNAPVGHEHTGKSLLKVFIVMIIIIGATAGLVFAAYTLTGSNKTAQAPQNANVYAQPTQQPIATPTPTPAGYVSNPNDNTDTAINQDSQAADTNLTNLDTSLSNVDQSMNDKQTNLQ